MVPAAVACVGAPDIPDDVTLWGLLIPIRREFEQYVNLRPVRALPGVESPLRAGQVYMVIVRENNEGEYSSVGERVYSGRRSELAVQEAVFTRTGVERVTRFALDVARRRLPAPRRRAGREGRAPRRSPWEGPARSTGTPG